VIAAPDTLLSVAPVILYAAASIVNNVANVCLIFSGKTRSPSESGA
jgi:hypothetical protein